MLRLKSTSINRLRQIIVTQRIQSVLVITVVLICLGCQLSGAESQRLVQQAQPQYLPVSATAVIHGTEVALEVAKTPQQQALGLMYRDDLGDNRGMLFPFQPPITAAFWMKNTLIPLDIIYLRDQEVVTIHANVPPCQSQTCPTYPSSVPVDQVIELEAGQAEVLGLKLGDPVQVQFQQDSVQPVS